MSELDSAPIVRKMSQNEIDKLNKGDLKRAFTALWKEKSADDIAQQLAILLDQKLAPVNEALSDLRKEKEENCKHFRKLEERIMVLENTCEQQQRFWEEIDGKEREKNIVILGLQEDENSDEAKVSDIFSFIEVADAAEDMKLCRLGKEDDPTRKHPRPVHVQLKTKALRKETLEKAKALKDGDDSQKKIFIKRDEHPAIRRELGRLFQVQKEERKKAENAGKSIRYDFKERVLKCDDMIIDRFRPMYFQRETHM